MQYLPTRTAPCGSVRRTRAIALHTWTVHRTALGDSLFASQNLINRYLYYDNTKKGSYPSDNVLLNQIVYAVCMFFRHQTAAFALLVQLMDMRTTSNTEKKLELPENWNYYYYYYYYHHHHHRHHNHHHHHLQCIRPSL